MSESGLPTDQPQFNLFERINRAEPFLAIRILLLQAAVVLALGSLAQPVGSVPDDLSGFAGFVTGLFNKESLLSFGYPLRELVWDGEWWRILAGVCAPVCNLYFILCGLALLPLARLLERSLGRLSALAVYATGGATVVAVDLCWSSGVSAGGLGMLFATAGGVFAMLFIERRLGIVRPEGTVQTGWILLFLLWLLAWTIQEAAVVLKSSIEMSANALIEPSPVALVCAGVAGGSLAGALYLRKLAMVLPIMAPGNAERPLNEPLVGRVALLTAVSGVGLIVVCVVGWNSVAGVDYRVWKMEPELRVGEPAAQASLKTLAGNHPEDLFLQKRLAVSYLRHGQWEAARPILDSLLASVSDEGANGQLKQLRYQRRAVRLAELNRRGPAKGGSWAYTGQSNNYAVYPDRLVWDLAHLGLGAGNQADVDAHRAKILGQVEHAAVAIVSEASAVAPAVAMRASLILNGQAWARAELGGDLSKALAEANESVSLETNANNLDTQAWILFKLGRVQEAVEVFAKALEYPDVTPDGTIHYHLGRCYDSLGEAAAARDHYLAATSHELDWWDQRELFERCEECRDAAVSGVMPRLLAAELE